MTNRVITMDDILSLPSITVFISKMSRGLGSLGFLSSILEDKFFDDLLVLRDNISLHILLIEENLLSIVTFMNDKQAMVQENNLSKIKCTEIEQLRTKFLRDIEVYEIKIISKNRQAFHIENAEVIEGNLPEFIGYLNRTLVK